MMNSTLPDPVFIFGAERSGTTMFRLMLDAHNKICNPSETDFLFDYLSCDKGALTEWRYDLAALKRDRIFQALNLEVEKDLDGLELLTSFLVQLGAEGPDLLTLNVHRNIELIFQLFPNSKFIHVLRDPRDVARSSIGMGWVGSMYFGVDHWIKTEREWDRAATGLQVGQVLDLRYEELFKTIQKELTRVSNFLGLDYDPNMLRFHETTSYSEPNTNSVQQWRRKAGPKEIALVEGKAHALMESRGYDLYGPIRIPGAFEKRLLSAQNKLAVWRFGMRKFGALLFIVEKTARLFHLKKLDARLKLKMQKITIQNLQ